MQQGFTLIELSIVLVIIGLIVGGVLVGQDLIKTAAIRAQVGQIEKYNSAVNAFRLKYNALPGDINATAASRFGFATRTGEDGRGDGDSLLEGSQADSSLLCAETVLFWADLSIANMADGSYSGADGSANDTSCATPPLNQVETFIPLAKVRDGNFIIVYGDSGKNYYQIVGGITGIDSDGLPAGMAPGMSPQEAFMTDSKLDDSYPNSGRVRSRDASATNGIPTMPGTQGAAGATVCGNTGTTPVSYNVGTHGNTINCSISLPFN